MLERRFYTSKQFWGASATRFFSGIPHNLQEFNKYSLNHYCSQLPDFPSMLAVLQASGQFLHRRPVPYNMSLLLESKISQRQLLDCTPKALLSQALPDKYTVTASLPEDAGELKDNLNQRLPATFKKLTEKIVFYLLLMVDVRSNQLAQRNYEAGVPDQENVSERVHGLQAAKITALLGLPDDDILAMLFHDIARPTHENDGHGHSNHHKEGATILAPLGLFPYTQYHAYGKHLLNKFCRPYQALLSPVSRSSLLVQNQSMDEQLEGLNRLDSLSLAKRLYLIMLMRLFDDMSKMPDRNLEYLRDSMIKKMLFQQIETQLALQAKKSKDPHQASMAFEQQLDEAMVLLLRPRSYSNNKELYQQFSRLIEVKPRLKP